MKAVDQLVELYPDWRHHIERLNSKTWIYILLRRHPLMSGPNDYEARGATIEEVAENLLQEIKRKNNAN